MSEKLNTLDLPTAVHSYVPESPEVEDEAMRRLKPVVAPNAFKLHFPEEPSMAPPALHRPHTSE
jgi:hypothetical protein